MNIITPVEAVLPPSLSIIAAAWNQTAEQIMQRYGVERGTHELMRAVIADPWLGDKTALVSSFGIEAAVPLAILAEVGPDLPVLFIDTGYSFVDTIEYRDRLVGLLGLSDLRISAPSQEQLGSFDPLRKENPTCCDEVKKKLLDGALEDFKVWFSGRKRFQGGKRTDIPLVEVAQGKIKVNPMALWTEAQIDSFMRQRGLPQHPLKSRGYGSVGCYSCTLPGKGREGRWPGSGKTECGIHNPQLHIDGSGI